MTMQVGMVGTDGVLIASDTLWINDRDGLAPLTETQSFVRYTEDSPKIMCNHERGIAISRAKNMRAATRVAEAIIRDLSATEMAKPRNSIEKIGETAVASLELKSVHCLIALQHPRPELYSFECGRFGDALEPTCRKITGAIPAGDNMNAAVFWRERYYEEPRPLKTLIPLAAHMIMSASKLSSGSIRGLEIVLCDAFGLHRLDDDSIGKLKAQANQWDQQIGALFANYTQDLTYLESQGRAGP
jgi:hypothetical protein